MTTKLSYRPHFTKEWGTDPFVRGLPLEPRMVYLELLDIAWDEGGLRREWLETGFYVAKRIGITPAKFRRIFSRLAGKFRESHGDLISNPRLEITRAAAISRASRASKASKERHRTAETACAQETSRAEQKRKEKKRKEKRIKREDPEETAGAGAPPVVQGRAKKGKTKKPDEPLPFTIGAALEALKASSGGRMVIDPFDVALAKSITAVIRTAPDLDDWRLAGRWIAAGGEAWRSYDLRWLAKGGNLTATIGHARRWKELGEPALDRNGEPSKVGPRSYKNFAPPMPHATESRDEVL